MDEYQEHIELHIWREAGAGDVWRCRVVAPGTLHTVRLDSHADVSAYVASQIDMLIEGYKLNRPVPVYDPKFD